MPVPLHSPEPSRRDESKLAKGSCFYHFGEFRLDGHSKVLLLGAEPVRLPLKATEILLTLLEHSGEVVTKDQIMSAVWGDRVVDDANLKQNIAVIRKTLGIAPGAPGHIDTYVGRGYRIAGPVQREAAGGQLSALSQTRPARFRWRVAMLISFAVLAVAFAYWRYANPLVPAPSTVAHVTPVTRLPGAEFQPEVSPDGKKVAFAWQQKDGKPPGIWVKSLNSADPVHIGARHGRHASPAWSPDGKSLAYLWIGVGRTDILLANADGSGERVLASVPQSSYIFRQRLLDWSPDGKWLCLSLAEDPTRGSTLFLIDTQTGDRRRLTNGEATPGNDIAPRFSPDGSTISYIRHIGRTEQELCVASIRGGALRRQLTSDRKLITGQDWDTQGQSIVFASNRSGEFRLWRIAVGGSAQPRPLEIFGEYPMDISIARHASVLVYSVETEDRDIWRLDLRPDQKDKRWERLIASSAQDASPQYSPDGSRICFRSNRSGEDQLWLADANGDHAVQLTTGALHPNFGHWSPDGRSIVFNDRSSAIHIAEWRDNQWVFRRLAPTGSHPVFSKDGQSVYAGLPSAIVRIPYGGGNASTIANVRAFSLAVSPDGGFIYFVGEDGTRLWRVPAAGGAVEQVLDALLPGCGSCWAVAPGGIYYLTGKNSLDDQYLYFRDFSARKDVQVMPYPEPLVPLGSGPFSLSPDFRYLLCVRTEVPGGDLMKVDPFR